MKDAFIIGLSQALAVLPGLSRSGTTIATGLLLGNKRKTSPVFVSNGFSSYYRESFLGLIGGEFSAEQSGIPTLSLIIGFIAAFISGCFACKWMINIVKKES